METPNIKIYIGISLALIILFILVLIIPFTKQPNINQQISTINIPTPTSVETNPATDSGQTNNHTSVVVPADFTGVTEEKLPQQVIDLAAQKKDLRQKIPLSLSAFSIDFDYSQDKFVVTLNDPKDLSQKVFESWRVANYPGLSTDQFLLK